MKKTTTKIKAEMQVVKTVNSTPRFFHNREEAIAWLKESVTRQLQDNPELYQETLDQQGRWGAAIY